jgi:hypothetical protein
MTLIFIQRLVKITCYTLVHIKAGPMFDLLSSRSSKLSLRTIIHDIKATFWTLGPLTPTEGTKKVTTRTAVG